MSWGLSSPSASPMGYFDAGRNRYRDPTKLRGFAGCVGELPSRRGLEGRDEEAGECYGGARDRFLEHFAPARRKHRGCG